MLAAVSSGPAPFATRAMASRTAARSASSAWRSAWSARSALRSRLTATNAVILPVSSRTGEIAASSSNSVPSLRRLVRVPRQVLPESRVPQSAW